MKWGLVLFANQLWQQQVLAKGVRGVVLVEHGRYFSDFAFNKKKLMLHRASMKAWVDEMDNRKLSVEYVEHKRAMKGGWLRPAVKRLGLERILYYDPVDKVLEEELLEELKAAKIEFERLDSEGFLCRHKSLEKFFADRKSYSMASFYSWQRKRLGVLVEGDEPVGGKWSFDTENREKLGEKVEVPEVRFYGNNKYVREAALYVEKNFGDNPGQAEGFFWPVSREEARGWLSDFLENRLANFGPFEDAISTEHQFVFHSLLSPSLNTGLLRPGEVLEAALQYANRHEVPLRSLEGFVRQVMGWREFMRAVYEFEGQRQQNGNFWGHSRKLCAAFYEGTTGVVPVDETIGRVMKSGYCHHIERLMVLGSFMQLCEIEPGEVYQWFMELFIDAYDWVMVPNVFGMSQYADGGLITTKPYICSSNYIRKMSDYKTGPWCDVWDALYWRFVSRHRKTFEANARTKRTAAMLERMDRGKLEQHVRRAEEYLAELFG